MSRPMFPLFSIVVVMWRSRWSLPATHLRSCSPIEITTRHRKVSVYSELRTSKRFDLILGIEYFPFTSVHHWGESPIGQWTLRVETRRPQTRESLKSAKEEPTGALKHFGLLFYGSFAEEETKHRPGSNTFAFTPNDDELRTIYNLELSLRQSPHLMQKRDYQNLLKERQVREETRENSSRFERFRKFFTFWIFFFFSSRVNLSH